MLLFTNKEQTPPLFAALAANTRDLGFGFGAVHDSEAGVLEDFKVKTVWPPAICHRPQTLSTFQLRQC